MDTAGAATREPSRKSTHPSNKKHITDADREEARTKIREAFAHAGLIQGGSFVCPSCNKVHRQKSTLSVRDIGTWKCFSSNAGGDAISLVQDRLGMRFPDAVNLLLGRATSTAATPKPVPANLPPISDARPTSVVDPEVYAEVLEFSGSEGRKAAADYYGFWHIAPEAVAESRASRVLDCKKLEQHLVSTFGMDRLKNCGLVVETKSKKDYFLLNSDYPVIEPHLSPAGKVLGMQFRPSERQREKIEAHNRYAAAKERGDHTVPEAKYVPKFLSLSGIDPQGSLVGFGLPRLWYLQPGSYVRIVEGFKDYLAARTLGHDAYAMAGTSAARSDRVLEVLKRFRVLVAMDGDEAGRAAQEDLVDYYRDHGVHAAPMPMPDGMDVADILVSRYAERGCTDEVCTHWRQAS